MESDTPRWVALAVVQSYNSRRKVPRSEICIPDLEACLFKASFAAAQNSGTFRLMFILMLLYSIVMANFKKKKEEIIGCLVEIYVVFLFGI